MLAHALRSDRPVLEQADHRPEKAFGRVARALQMLPRGHHALDAQSQAFGVGAQMVIARQHLGQFRPLVHREQQPIGIVLVSHG